MSRTPSTPNVDGAARRDSNCLARPSGSDAVVVALLERIALAVESLANRTTPSPLLDRRQMAALVGVDLRTLRRLELAGDVPRAMQVGSAKRWKRADVDAWLAGKRR